MRLAHYLAIATVALAACAGDFPPDGFGPYLIPEPRPGQDHATEIVWRRVYAQEGPPPAVYWRRERLDCAGYGWTPEGYPSCVSGLYVHDEPDDAFGVNLSGWHAEVALPGDQWAISDTTFAHELCHAAFGDLGHVGACRYGAGGLVAAANSALWWEWL